MKLMKIALAAGAVLILAVLVVFASMGLVIFDLVSYTATGSETLSSAGVPAGSALVVYDPGLTGTARSAATEIAGDLRAKGYTVQLAGVRSSAAANTTGYDVIVVGGPTYAGNLSSSAKAYLGNLHPAAGTTVGVFATGGVAPEREDPAYLREFVTGQPNDSPLAIKLCAKLLSGDDLKQKSSEFVAGLVG